MKLWIARISVFDASASYRISVCADKEDAQTEALMMDTIYEPESGVDIFEATMAETLVMIGAIRHEARTLLGDVEDFPREIRLLLPYCTDRALKVVIDVMVGIANLRRSKEKQHGGRSPHR